MDFWLVWHSLAMITIVSVSFAAGFFTCKVIYSKTPALKNLKNK